MYKQLFPYSGNLLFNKSFIRLVQTDYVSSGKSYFSTVEPLLELEENSFQRKSLFLLVTSDFPAIVNLFVLHFSETPTNNFFLSNGRKSVFQRKLSFRLAETDFRANNGFHKQEEKLWIKEHCFH